MNDIGGDFAPDIEEKNDEYTFKYKRFIGGIYKRNFLLIKICFLPKYVTRNITSLLNQAYSDGLEESKEENEN